MIGGSYFISVLRTDIQMKIFSYKSVRILKIQTHVETVTGKRNCFRLIYTIDCYRDGVIPTVKSYFM